MRPALNIPVYICPNSLLGAEGTVTRHDNCCAVATSQSPHSWFSANCGLVHSVFSVLCCLSTGSHSVLSQVA